MLLTGETWNPSNLVDIETLTEQRKKYLKSNLKSDIRQLLSIGLTIEDLKDFIQQNAKTIPCLTTPAFWGQEENLPIFYDFQSINFYIFILINLILTLLFYHIFNHSHTSPVTPLPYVKHKEVLLFSKNKYLYSQVKSSLNTKLLRHRF